MRSVIYFFVLFNIIVFNFYCANWLVIISLSPANFLFYAHFNLCTSHCFTSRKECACVNGRICAHYRLTIQSEIFEERKKIYRFIKFAGSDLRNKLNFGHFSMKYMFQKKKKPRKKTVIFCVVALKTHPLISFYEPNKSEEDEKNNVNIGLSE